MQATRRIGFVGGGNMAAALIGGLTRLSGIAATITVLDPDAARLDRLVRTFGVTPAVGCSDVVAEADVVVLAVKPDQMRRASLDVAASIAGARPLILSVAAGIPHGALLRWLGASARVVRTMPNRPALNGFGATGLYAPPNVDASGRELAESIMGAVGVTAWVDEESQLDAVTALSGSGPAYFFLFMEALEAAARASGLAPAIARKLTLQTALGSAHMALAADEPLAALKDQVTSKGGTTAAALAVLEAADLRAIVAEAVAAAARRSAELGAEFGNS